MNNLEKKQDQPLTMKGFFDQDSIQKKIQEILGKNAKQFATNVLQVVGQNSLLQKAEPSSVFNSAMMASMLDLPLNPSLGLAYIVPYNQMVDDGKGNKIRKCVAQFQIGYKGLKQLAIRSGQFRSIETKPVFEGQVVNDNSFVGFHFDWMAKTSDKVIGYANRFELLNGFEKTLYMTIEQIQSHGKKYSKSYDLSAGQWKKDFNAMALKTVSKLNLNSGEAPLSIEMQKAINSDQAIINDFETEDVTYVDNGEDLKAEKPTLNDNEILDCIGEIKAGNVTFEAISSEYELTEIQIKNIQDAVSGN